MRTTSDSICSAAPGQDSNSTSAHQGGDGAEGTRRNSATMDRCLDELTSTLTEADARLLVDLLKLAALDRVQADGAKETIANVLIGNKYNEQIQPRNSVA